MTSDLVLHALRLACASHPKQRVMQVLVNALGSEVTATGAVEISDPFYLKDETMIGLLRSYAAETHEPGEWE